MQQRLVRTEKVEGGKQVLVAPARLKSRAERDDKHAGKHHTVRGSAGNDQATTDRQTDR